MRVAPVCRALAGLGILLAALPLPARVYDHLYGNGFDVPADAPASDAEAARFLTQATFGPTKSEIARLRAIGIREWIDQQLGMAPTLARPYVETTQAALTAATQTISNTQRNDRWYWTAAYAPDQLRQRMAFALSQIFVISDTSSSISQYYVPMADYQDLLARDAFGIYRTLLGDVTWHPMMGRYLSHFRNQKPSATSQPDENYAREVMQLFSVGLVERNLDFSPALSGGQPVPTYDQATITHTAKVFTGFTWSDAQRGSGPPGYSGANFYTGGATLQAQYAPMDCWGTDVGDWNHTPGNSADDWGFPIAGTGSSKMLHDVTGDDGVANADKTVIRGLHLPPNQSCRDDVNDLLDILAAHPNVAPFIARQLIQRFVGSNPSPAYIARVAAVFNDNGAPEHESGDLGAVIKAILTDAEARTVQADPAYGKLREPLLRLTAMWRAWNAQPQAANAWGEVKMGISAGSGRSNFGQAPLGAPSVFNFYEPDYRQPGPIADAVPALYSPEFQITNEGSAYTTGNKLADYSRYAHLGMTTTLPTDRPLLDLSPLTALNGNAAAMVDEANLRMLYGTMSTNMRNTLLTLLTDMNGATADDRAWSLVYVISLSPEYATQR